jgi:hypothetical protein
VTDQVAIKTFARLLAEALVFANVERFARLRVGGLPELPRSCSDASWRRSGSEVGMQTLQCLHADLSFPGVAGFDESRNLITVIDAAFRYSWCKPLKLKGAPAYELQCLKVHLEKMFAARIEIF